MIGFGLAIGLGGAFALTRVMSGLLFGVSATDVTTFGLIPLILAVIAVVADVSPGASCDAGRADRGGASRVNCVPRIFTEEQHGNHTERRQPGLARHPEGAGV